MPSSSGQAILLAVVLALILISAFISLAETAFLNMSKGKLRYLVEEDVPGAEKLADLVCKKLSVQAEQKQLKPVKPLLRL